MESFDQLDLNPVLQQTIAQMGFSKPSEIQAQALPILLGSKVDFIGLAATGTGKTAAFAIPMLERIASSKGARTGVQALILCPTRELALQVSGQIDQLGKGLGVRSVPIYGGAGYGDQIRGIRSGAAVVVGTPGRVIDHLEKGTLSLDGIDTLILDEADEMISMGFKEDLETVLSNIDRERSNVWLFSATMSREVRKVADTYLQDPEQVQINRGEMLPSTIEQIYFATQENNKPEIIKKLIDAADEFYGLIFCQTKALVIDLTQYLKNEGYRVDCLHGDMDQNARERTMRAFRERAVTTLICTDVASRGLDVKDVTHVINYSLPREMDNYVHRIGRTGRSGKTGIAYSLVTASHRGLIGRIEKMTKSRMVEGRIPSRKEIAAKKLARSLPKFLEQEAHAKAAELLSPEWREALAEMPGEEIAARFLAILHGDIFNPAPKQPERAPLVKPNSVTAGRPAPQVVIPRDQAPKTYSRPPVVAKPEAEAQDPAFGMIRLDGAALKPPRAERPPRHDRAERVERNAKFERRERPKFESSSEEREDRPSRPHYTQRVQHPAKRFEKPAASRYGQKKPEKRAEFRSDRPERPERNGPWGGEKPWTRKKSGKGPARDRLASE